MHRCMEETVSLNSRRSAKQRDRSTGKRTESKAVVNTLIEVPPPRLSHAAEEGQSDLRVRGGGCHQHVSSSSCDSSHINCCTRSTQTPTKRKGGTHEAHPSEGATGWWLPEQLVFLSNVAPEILPCSSRSCEPMNIEAALSGLAFLFLFF